MYTMAIHAQQVMTATVVSFSLSETPDDGRTYTLATSASSSNLLAGVDEDPLWIFFEQIKQCLSRVLEDEVPTWSTPVERDGLDGGWRGAGNPGQPERSEDR